jgi:predicted  nucleic acid-binding Zn-ribbon protein
MEIHENKLLDDLKNQIANADKYKEELNVLNEKFYSILDDFKKYYIFFNKNPEVDEYQQMFSNIKDNIESINSKLFTINTNLQQTIDDINIKIQQINVEIQKEKTKNTELKNNVGIINNKRTSSGILIDNYKELYNNTYYFNITIVFGILILSFLFYKYKS